MWSNIYIRPYAAALGGFISLLIHSYEWAEVPPNYWVLSWESG
jgi:hypothetical protein